MRLASYQPDIAPNVGALMRLCAAFRTPLDLIEPFGFPWDEKKIRVSAMDYFDLVTLTRHHSWEKFLETSRTGPSPKRIVLLTTKATDFYTDFSFTPDDILLLGRESAGVPDAIHESIPHRIKIPMNPAARSINMAMAGSIVLAEALRQTKGFPE